MRERPTGPRTSPGAACCPQGQAPGAKGQCTIASCPAPAKLVAGTCCTADQLAPGGACAAKVCGELYALGVRIFTDDGACVADAECATNFCTDGVCCAEADVYKDASGAAACCTTGAVVDGKCTKPPLTGIPADPTCGSGYQPASDGVCCLASQLTAGGQCCPADQSPSGPAKTNCAATHTAGPPATPPSGNGGSTGKVCCASGSVPVAAGGCCALAQLTGTGVCCPAGQTPDPKRPGRCGAPTGTPVLVKETPPQPACAAGFSEMPDGSCCKTSNLSKDGLRCMAQSGKETVAPAGPIPVPVPIPSRSKAAPGDDDDDDDDDRRTSARQKAPSGEARRDRQPERSRDSERRELPKAEPAKREPPKPEPPKSDPPRPDPVRREPPKPEPPKREVPKAEPPKREVPKVNKLVVPKVLKVVPANKKQEKESLDRLEQAVLGTDALKNATLVRMSEVDDVDKQFLLERHLISREHLTHPEFKSVVVGDKEIVSVMINEEDHLRIQVIQSGFNLQECWRIASRLDDALHKKVQFAFNPEWGYLTACPTNTGTGLRASVMLHLPSLVMTKQIGRVLQAITKLGMTARGLYGEGTEAEGNFFQISNQITLGSAEEDVIDNLERAMAAA